MFAFILLNKSILFTAHIYSNKPRPKCCTDKLKNLFKSFKLTINTEKNITERLFCILCVASDVKLLTSLCQWEWVRNQFWVRQDWLIDFHILRYLVNWVTIVKIWRHKSVWKANACPTHVLKSYEFSLECYKMFCHSLCCTSAFLFLWHQQPWLWYLPL